MSRATWRTYVCNHVLVGEPALEVLYDGNPKRSHLAATCGRPESEHPHGAKAWSVMAWGCLLERDPSLAEVDKALSPDTWYVRTSLGAPWVIEPAEPEPDDTTAIALPAPAP